MKIVGERIWSYFLDNNNDWLTNMYSMNCFFGQDFFFILSPRTMMIRKAQCWCWWMQKNETGKIRCTMKKKKRKEEKNIVRSNYWHTNVSQQYSWLKLLRSCFMLNGAHWPIINRDYIAAFKIIYYSIICIVATTTFSHDDNAVNHIQFLSLWRTATTTLSRRNLSCTVSQWCGSDRHSSPVSTHRIFVLKTIVKVSTSAFFTDQ